MRNLWFSMCCFLLITSLLIYWIRESSIISSYITAVKDRNEISVMQPIDSNQQLYEKICREAQHFKIPPQDPRVDLIWKAAVPGYNGKQVDIEATYKKTLQQRSKKINWIYTDIVPNKSLENLGNLPIYRGHKNKKAVALMINVAWGTEHIKPMLEILKQKNAMATFFLAGSWLKENRDLAKKIKEAGHEIGNHAYNHPLMAQITSDRIANEIKRTEDIIFQTLRLRSKNFAPPAGSFDQRTVEIARRFNMKTVLWTVDTIDWKKSTSPELMLQRITKKIEAGNLVLMHPTDRTIKALPAIIDYIHKEHWQLLTVSDVLSSKRVD